MTRLLFVFLLALTGCLQSEREAPYPAVWQIEDPDGDNVYLFGSIHLLPKHAAWRSAAFEQALAEADAIYFEIADPTAAAPEIAAFVTENGRLAEGETLADLMAAEDYAKITSAAAFFDLHEATFIRTAPWLAALQLAVAAAQAEGADSAAGVEMVLAGDAAARALPTRGLETTERHLSSLTAMPVETQIDLLVQTAEEIMIAGAGLNDLVKAWMSDDLTLLEEAFVTPLRESPDLYDSVLVKRNEEWMSPLAALLDRREDALIVVGAAHLPGEDGLIRLLNEAGYAVTIAQAE